MKPICRIVQVGQNLHSLLLALRCFKLLLTPKVCVSAGRLLAACAHVVMGVTAAISEAPSAKAARAHGTLERKTALEIHEGVAIPGALQGEDLIHNVLTSPVNLLSC